MFLVLSGKMGSGKDTVLKELIKRFPNKKFVRVGYGDYLKEICVNLFNLKPEVVHGADKNIPTNYLWKNVPWYRWWKHFFKRNQPVTHREFLQYFGSDICRYINDDCWVDYVIRHFNDPNVIHVIIDARFKNEVTKMISSKKSVLIRLTRKPFDSKHISETNLDDFKWKGCELVDNKWLSINDTVNQVVTNFNLQSENKNLGIKLC
jgi:hypothetical protein